MTFFNLPNANSLKCVSMNNDGMMTNADANVKN